MAQGRSSKTISMVKWIRTSRLTLKNSLSLDPWNGRDRWNGDDDTTQWSTRVSLPPDSGVLREPSRAGQPG